MHKGQSLIELLVALTIITLALASVFMLFSGSQISTTDSGNSAQALTLAQEGIAASRALRESSWATLADGAHGLAFQNGQWQFVGTSDTTTIFTRTMTVSTIDANTKKIVTRIAWTIDPLRPQEIILTEQLTNWPQLAAQQGGGLSGDWTQPVITGSLALSTGNSATDVAVKNGMVYLTSTASSSAKPDFWVIDATNPGAPVISGSVNTGPGLNAIAILGSSTYAFAANRATPNQLHVIDISNPAAPTLATTLTLPGSDEALSITIAGTYAYIGLDNNGGSEFSIVDITNPLAPQLKGSLEIGGDVNAITVKNTYAYLATERDAEVSVVDVSNPDAPFLAGNYAAPGNSEDGKSIFILNTTAYLGRKKGGDHDDHHELHVLDLANLQPQQILARAIRQLMSMM